MIYSDAKIIRSTFQRNCSTIFLKVLNIYLFLKICQKVDFVILPWNILQYFNISDIFLQYSVLYGKLVTNSLQNYSRLDTLVCASIVLFSFILISFFSISMLHFAWRDVFEPRASNSTNLLGTQYITTIYAYQMPLCV